MPQSKFKNWVNLEVAKKLDKESFSSLPIRMRIGISILICSFIIGYGIPVLILIISGINKHLSTGILSSSFIYFISWILGAIGLVLAGKDCIKYPIYFFAKLVKMLFPGYFGKVN
jgi:hypothetical protein